MNENNTPASGDMAIYDFKHPERITKDQVRTIRALHEKFAQTFGTSLSTHLRTMIQVELLNVEQITYSEYMSSLPNPGCLYILGFSDIKGNAIFSIRPELTFYIIDRLLGGPGEQYEETRSVTLIEQSVMRNVVDKALHELNETWKQIMPLNPKVATFELNPLFVQVAPSTETVILISFSIKSNNIESTIDFCLPYFVLEQVLVSQSEQKWSGTNNGEEARIDTPLMNRKIKRVGVPLSVVLDMPKLSLNDLNQLQIGDIIRLDRRIHEELDVKVDNKIKYRGRPGHVGSRVAVQITSVVIPEEENPNV